MEFKDKAVLITGSSRGIGLATAGMFLRLGAAVAINGRTEESVQRAVRRLDHAGRLMAAPGDVSRPEDCKAIVNKVVDAFNGLDVLVNAAGVCFNAAVEDSDEALWDQTLNVNLKGTFFCARYALPALRRRKGVIVNLGSDAGLQGESGLSVYCAAKGGVVNLTRAMALELGPDIRVNCVCSGYVDTDMLRRDYIDKTENPAETEAALKRFSPLNRIATPEEIAQAVVYLSSAQARFITGAALQIDGGTTAGQH